MRLSFLFIALLAVATTVAYAGPITYNVTFDTSTISGSTGSLDFNFNPGPLSAQAASLQILSFTSDGTLAGSPSLIGNVTGTLPGTLTFDNGSGFNDYFQEFTYGTTIAFSVSLFGPALAAPDGLAASGSTFAFSMFSDPAGTNPALTSDIAEGFAYRVDVNLDGSTTASNFTPASTTPEPASVLLVGMPLALGFARRWLPIRPA